MIRLFFKKKYERNWLKMVKNKVFTCCKYQFQMRSVIISSYQIITKNWYYLSAMPTVSIQISRICGRLESNGPRRLVRDWLVIRKFLSPPYHFQVSHLILSSYQWECRTTSFKPFSKDPRVSGSAASCSEPENTRSDKDFFISDKKNVPIRIPVFNIFSVYKFFLIFIFFSKKNSFFLFINLSVYPYQSYHLQKM